MPRFRMGVAPRIEVAQQTARRIKAAYISITVSQVVSPFIDTRFASS